MEEAGSRNVGHGRSHLLTSMNHVHTESIDGVATNIVSIDARD
jgi:hypothetical protein